jgi:hypothetical protein
VPVSTTIRAARADELGVIARRMDRRREGAFVMGGGWRREAVGVGVIGAVATVASTVLVLRTQNGAFVIGGALGLTFVAIGLLGSRRASRSIEVRLTEIGRDQAETGRAITEYGITADRIVTAAGEDGDVWWLFRIDPGAWLAFEQGQWDGVDGSARRWCRETRIGVDAHRTVVSIESTGDPIVVERRDLRPPDFAPTPETLFWSPPDEAGALPVQIAGDPTGARGGESGR